MITSRSLRSPTLPTALLVLCMAGGAAQAAAQAQSPAPTTPDPSGPARPRPQCPMPLCRSPAPTLHPGRSQPTGHATAKSQQEKAAQQVRQQEHQRILGVVPNFNTSYVQDAAPLSRKQKFSLAFKSATDFGTILVAAVDAGYNQVTDRFPSTAGDEGIRKVPGCFLRGYLRRHDVGERDLPRAPETRSAFLSQGDREFQLSAFLCHRDHVLVQERQRKQGSELLQFAGKSCRRGDFQPLLSGVGPGRVPDLRARFRRHRGRRHRRRFRGILA